MFADWAPAIDVQETEKEYLLKADLPEVKKEDVKVDVRNGIHQDERRQEKEEKGKGSTGLSGTADSSVGSNCRPMSTIRRSPRNSRKAS